MEARIRELLGDFNLINEDKNNFYYKSKTGLSKIVKIPKKISPTLCCYIGLIIGDGHLRPNIKRVEIELTDLELIYKIRKLTLNLFGISPGFYINKDKRTNRKIRYRLILYNSAVHCLLNKIFEIPSGKKSNIVRIPQFLKESTQKQRAALLIGLLASDGGQRKRFKEIRLSSASKNLRDDISYILKRTNINVHTDQWINKKYKKTYYGLYFSQKYLHTIMRGYQSGQMGQIATSLIKKLQGQA